MCPYRIVRFVLREVEVDVDKGCHQEGLAGTHRKREEIVGIGDTIEDVEQGLLIIYLGGMMTDKLLQLGSNLSAVLVLQA